ncbi:extracellular solute-binding protein [Roseibacillus persicicus]|uniref:extracellular solute-binding protein n=1 Tax=Roseibacillus persicicus TaxID=454148 RepID=UPI00398A6FB9
MRLLLPFLFFSCLIGCKNSSNDTSEEVVIYTSLDRVHSEPVFRKFEQETGIKVRAVYDTEASKTVGLVNRLIAEKNRPKADVFWNSEILRTLILKEKGLLTPYTSPNAAAIPDTFKDSAGYWTGFAARARVIFYNTDRVQEPPTTLAELSTPQWREQVAIANPLFGTTNTQLAVWWQEWGPDKTQGYLTSLKQNGVHIVPGNGPARDLVASGEIALCLTDTDDAWQAISKKRPVAMIYPDQEGEGTLLIPNTVCLIANGPNPETGKKLIDYLLSEETESYLAHSASAQIPVRDSVPRPEHVRSLEQIVHQKVDFEAARQQVTTASEWAQREFLNP